MCCWLRCTGCLTVSAAAALFKSDQYRGDLRMHSWPVMNDTSHVGHAMGVPQVEPDSLGPLLRSLHCGGT